MIIRDIDIEDILTIDTGNMLSILKNFPLQVKEAIQIGEASPGYHRKISTTDFHVLGMGGSAIAGDILNTFNRYTPGAEHISLKVNRDYDIPGTINEYSNVIVSSYSGGTEETLSGLEKARARTGNIICISSGGQISNLALQNNFPLITVPGGYQPRCAIGYSFFPMLHILMKSGAYEKMAMDSIKIDLKETYDILKEKSELYSEWTDNNPAYVIAKKLAGYIPVIYSSNRLDSINLRWRCQIQENAKNLVFGSVLPEMNHNEINSWEFPTKSINNFKVIFLEDNQEHARVKIRIDAVGQILKDIIPEVINIKSDGKSYLARIFDLIYLGDFISYFLAIFNRVDPTPIPLIIKLKDILSGT